MMDALEAIQTRRSVRKYEKRNINDEIVEKLLSAAMSAPSAVNQQPWEFIVIKDREMLDAIPAFSKFGGWRHTHPSAYLSAAILGTLSPPDSGCKTALQLRRTF